MIGGRVLKSINTYINSNTRLFLMTELEIVTIKVLERLTILSFSVLNKDFLFMRVCQFNHVFKPV